MSVVRDKGACTPELGSDALSAAPPLSRVPAAEPSSTVRSQKAPQQKAGGRFVATKLIVKYACIQGNMKTVHHQLECSYHTCDASVLEAVTTMVHEYDGTIEKLSVLPDKR